MNNRDAIEHYLTSKSKPLVEGWATLEKLRYFYDLIIKHQLLVGVEIGVFGGRGALALAMAYREMEQQFGVVGCVHAIDPWSTEAATEGTLRAEDKNWWVKVPLAKIGNDFQRYVKDHQLEKWVKIHKAKAQEVVAQFLPASIDFLHLDGNHSPECFTREAEQWAPLVSPKGIIVMTDADAENSMGAYLALTKNGFGAIENYGPWCVYQRPEPETEPEEESVVGDVEAAEVTASIS